MRTAWGNDAKKYTPDMVVTLAYAENRKKALEVDADIYVINTDAVKWLLKNMDNSFFQRFDTLIIDESEAFKHHTSQRSKAALKLSKLRTKKRGGEPIFKHRALLSATPFSGSVTELWHQALLLDSGDRLGDSFFKFRNAVCEPEQIGPSANHLRWVDKPGAEEAVAGLLSDITIRHEFDKCMDIPQNHSYFREYQLPPKLMAEYLRLKEEAVLMHERGEVTAINAAVLHNKLLQLVSGAVYGDPSDPDADYVLLDSGRYEFTVDLALEVPHSIIFFNWRHQLDQLEKHLEQRGVRYATINGDVPVAKREVIVDQYQAGFFDTLLLHPLTGAHGITLTKGTRSVWASATAQPNIYKQGKHRIWRGGQTLATENIMVAAADTIEIDVFKRWEQRNAKMENLLEFMTA